MIYLLIIVAAILLLAALWFRWRRGAWPCPANLSWLVDNPFMNAVAGRRAVLDRIDLGPGMKLLDVGCGPGRLSVPAARTLGDGGLVVALDLQPAMLRKAEERALAAGLGNIRFLQAGAGEGKVQRNFFDRAILVTVLGEIKDRGSALTEIYEALVPGGILSVTEMLPDPHYISKKRLRRLASKAGFREKATYGGPFAYNMTFVKPS